MIIDRFSGEYRWLSNFSPVKIKFEDIIYPSVENAYQAAKTLSVSDREKISKVSASNAKRLGRLVKIRNDWDTIKLAVMENLLREKFSNHIYKKLLLSTRNAILIEGNYWNDTFWGICNNKGQNHLGKLIMKIRNEYINQDNQQ